MRNAGVNLKDQAQVQNLKYFVEREQERQRQRQPTLMDAVDQITNVLAGQQPVPKAAEVQQQTPPPPPPTDPTEDNQMDMATLETEMNQGDVSMGDGTGAHEADDMEAAGTTEA